MIVVFLCILWKTCHCVCISCAQFQIKVLITDPAIASLSHCVPRWGLMVFLITCVSISFLHHFKRFLFLAERRLSLTSIAWPQPVPSWDCSSWTWANWKRLKKLSMLQSKLIEMGRFSGSSSVECMETLLNSSVLCKGFPGTFSLFY